MMEFVDESATQKGETQVLYKTWGTCSQFIDVAVKDGFISRCQFLGGCDGNTKGLSKLVVGMRPDEVIQRLKGTLCGSKRTSCPDQLCHALEEVCKKAKAEEKAGGE